MKIEREYFKWLTSQIEIPVGNPHTYNDLFSRMHEIEFVWHVPNDGNRVQDGLDLRVQFLNGNRHDFNMGATILEVLLGLSNRLAFNAGGTPENWAWTLIENLQLDQAYDPFNKEEADRVDEILEALIWRTYQPDGQGGFFPLASLAPPDQTKVEIWDQMSRYINEIHQL